MAPRVSVAARALVGTRRVCAHAAVRLDGAGIANSIMLVWARGKSESRVPARSQETGVAAAGKSEGRLGCWGK